MNTSGQGTYIWMSILMWTIYWNYRLTITWSPIRSLFRGYKNLSSDILGITCLLTLPISLLDFTIWSGLMTSLVLRWVIRIQKHFMTTPRNIGRRPTTKEVLKNRERIRKMSLF